VTFKPDGTIFQTTEFNFEILSARLRELAFLNKGILLTIKDKGSLLTMAMEEQHAMKNLNLSSA